MKTKLWHNLKIFISKGKKKAVMSGIKLIVRTNLIFPLCKTFHGLNQYDLVSFLFLVSFNETRSQKFKIFVLIVHLKAAQIFSEVDF